MVGKKNVHIKAGTVEYDLVLHRDITILQGDSATGKTTLANLISQSGISPEIIHVNSETPIITLFPDTLDIVLKNNKGKEQLYIVDEDNMSCLRALNSKMVRGSNSYFVLITREDLPQLNYSYIEIYKLVSKSVGTAMRRNIT